MAATQIGPFCAFPIDRADEIVSLQNGGYARVSQEQE
jgi:hypothetical protein